MKKGKILVVLLIGLLTAGGLILVGCGAAFSCKGSCKRPDGGCSIYCADNSSSSDSQDKACSQACK